MNTMANFAETDEGADRLSFVPMTPRNTESSTVVKESNAIAPHRVLTALKTTDVSTALDGQGFVQSGAWTRNKSASVQPTYSTQPTSVPKQQTQSEINAVVQEVGEHSIVLMCLLDGRELRIKLPPSLVPDSLQRFGAPVTIRLSNVNGYRRPVIEQRHVTRPELTEEDNATDAWITSLKG